MEWQCTVYRNQKW